MKAFAARPQDVADLEYLLAGHWNSLDLESVELKLEEICETAENDTSVPKFHAMTQNLARQLGQN